MAQSRKTVTALIPAKGSSSRLPHKNILKCDGVPLVKRAVLLAKESGIFQRIHVSTESREVYEACEGKAAWHVRPPALSLPSSNVMSAVNHFCQLGIRTDYVMLLHPTSPCLRVESIRKAFLSLSEHATLETLISVNTTSPFSWVAGNKPDFSKAKGTQDYPKRYCLNNALLISTWDNMLKQRIYGSQWAPFVIPPDEAIDIDELVDLQMAEAILQWRKNHEVTEPPTGDIRVIKPTDVDEGRVTFSSNAGHRADKSV